MCLLNNNTRVHCYSQANADSKVGLVSPALTQYYSNVSGKRVEKAFMRIVILVIGNT